MKRTPIVRAYDDLPREAERSVLALFNHLDKYYTKLSCVNFSRVFPCCVDSTSKSTPTCTDPL